MPPQKIPPRGGFYGTLADVSPSFPHHRATPQADLLKVLAYANKGSIMRLATCGALYPQHYSSRFVFDLYSMFTTRESLPFKSSRIGFRQPY